MFPDRTIQFERQNSLPDCQPSKRQRVFDRITNPVRATKTATSSRPRHGSCPSKGYVLRDFAPEATLGRNLQSSDCRSHLVLFATRESESERLWESRAAARLENGPFKVDFGRTQNASKRHVICTNQQCRRSLGHVDLKVKHLAKPENLTPPHSVYIVWMQPRGGAPIKQGQLEVNSNLEAEFETPTTYNSFEIFVTAEDSSMVTQPTGQEVLRQTVSG